MEPLRKLPGLDVAEADPLARALARKAATGMPGAAEGRLLAAGDGWRVLDVVCTSGPDDLPFEERHEWASVSLVHAGTFVCRGARGSSLLAPGALLLGTPGTRFECSHRHGAGDRCLSFQLDPALFERVADDAGARRAAFAADFLPPLRALARATTRARLAPGRGDSLEEIALDLAGEAIRVAARAPGAAPGLRPGDEGRISRLLRELETRFAEPHTLEALARSAGLSRYHFLRTFRRVTGVTPHQWLVRARLRWAAERLAGSRDPVTWIALDAGYEDLSNFIRSFRAELGVSPSRWRAAA